jgi:S-formylglutathione hydrolase FrmB
MLRRMTAIVAIVCCLPIAGCAEPKTGPPAVYQTPTEAAAARIVATRRIDARTRDLTIDSPAVGKQVKVRLLLPASFGSTSRRWPVLYLLHGCCDSYVSWTRSTDIEKLSSNTGLIVAMPEGGAVGFYSDWLVGPRWETLPHRRAPGAAGRQLSGLRSARGCGTVNGWPGCARVCRETNR